MVEHWTSSKSRRMAQLEDDLAGQQRQLDKLGKALSKVVDMHALRLQKEHVEAELSSKVDLGRFEKHVVDTTDQMEVHQQQLADSLAKKVDAWVLEECRVELANVTLGLEQRHSQLAQSVAEDRVSAEEARQAMTRDSQARDEVLSASLVDNFSALEDQCRRLACTDEFATQLEAEAAERSREHLGSLLSLEMHTEAMHRASADQWEKQRVTLEETQAELVDLVERFEQHKRESSLEYQSELQEEWLQHIEREDASRKKKQDEQLTTVLANKADIGWFEQQKAMLDAAQVSLSALRDGHQELHVEMMEGFSRTADNLSLEAIHCEWRQEASEVSRKLERYGEHLDVVRGQMLELIRQQAALQASLGEKLEKAD